MATHKFFFKRNRKSMNGVLTLLKINDDGTSKKVFDKVPVRSGQNGFYNTDWVRGKSPTPVGDWWLCTNSIPLQFEPYGTRFYPICSDKKNKRLIIGKTGQVRGDVGLHKDNKFPSSIGCTVIPNHNTADDVFDYIDSIEDEFIQFKVFY